MSKRRCTKESNKSYPGKIPPPGSPILARALATVAAKRRRACERAGRSSCETVLVAGVDIISRDGRPRRNAEKSGSGVCVPAGVQDLGTLRNSLARESGDLVRASPRKGQAAAGRRECRKPRSDLTRSRTWS